MKKLEIKNEIVKFFTETFDAPQTEIYPWNKNEHKELCEAGKVLEKIWICEHLPNSRTKMLTIAKAIETIISDIEKCAKTAKKEKQTYVTEKIDTWKNIVANINANLNMFDNY